MSSLATAAGLSAPDAQAAASAPVRSVRDARLDAARGLAMLIIFVAHVPGNGWALWIPARWGFSDATEIFVFCSGMASAIAFGGTFARAGWALGTARIGYRLWQLYWAHLGMFLTIFAILAGIDSAGWSPDKHHVGSLNLWKMLEVPADALIGLVTLRWVPNYFDILPMYMAVLAMLPLVVALRRVSAPLAMAASVVLWLLAQRFLLDWLGLRHFHLTLPAEPWSDRTWFFNPFGWQLLFFTGFAFQRGWLPAPPVTRGLLWLACGVVLASLAVSSVGFRLWETDLLRALYVAATGCAETGFGACNPVYDWRIGHEAWLDKTDLSFAHYAHFLALAYLAWAAAGAGGARLTAAARGAWGGVVSVLVTVGRQSLAVFVFSMVLAQVAGYALDLTGRGALTLAAVNLVGLGLLVACAQVAGWFRSQPWRAAR